jgi:hypothetical protein
VSLEGNSYEGEHDLPALAGDATLVTIDPAADQVAAVAELFAADAGRRVRLRVGDWRDLADDGPFRLLFVDGGDGKTQHPDDVVAMVEPGGVIVLDDFSPTTEWPPMFGGDVDHVRMWWLTAPCFAAATAVDVGPTMTCVMAVKRP